MPLPDWLKQEQPSPPPEAPRPPKAAEPEVVEPEPVSEAVAAEPESESVPEAEPVAVEPEPVAIEPEPGSYNIFALLFETTFAVISVALLARSKTAAGSQVA